MCRTCKVNLMAWLSACMDEMDEGGQAGVRHCWDSTGLLGAWDRDVQIEAAGKAALLFHNMDAADVRDVSES